MSNKLIIFTLKTCGNCKFLKRKLKQNNIEFKEIDIDEYPTVWDMVVQQSEVDYVPTAYLIQDDDTGIIFSPGKDYTDHEDLIKKIEEYLK
jgi:glutaredoxin